MSDIESLKKTNKVQKNEIKPLTNENDKLRREISKCTGLRRFTESAPNFPVSDENTTAGTHKSDNAKCESYDELRIKLIPITDSLLGALDDQPPKDFTTVRHKRRAVSKWDQATSIPNEPQQCRHIAPATDGLPEAQASSATPLPEPTTWSRLWCFRVSWHIINVVRLCVI